MRPEFSIQSRCSAGNLYVKLFGEFNGMCAWELFKTIKKKGVTYGRVFVDTAGLDKLNPAGVDLFRHHMSAGKYPGDWLYFKGNKGFTLAPDGSRVLIAKNSDHRKKRPIHRRSGLKSFHFSPQIVRPEKIQQEKKTT